MEQTCTDAFSMYISSTVCLTCYCCLISEQNREHRELRLPEESYIYPSSKQQNPENTESTAPEGTFVSRPF